MLAGITAEDAGGGQVVIIATTETGWVHAIERDALASWSELLGLDDVVDVLEAIIATREERRDETNPDTGENTFTEAFTVLRHREQAREAEVRQALVEGKRDDPRSPKLRGAMAARRAVMESVGAQGDRDSLAEKVRGKARGRLTAPVPRTPRITGRIGSPQARTEAHSDPQPGRECRLTAQDRQRASETLTPLLADVSRSRERFLHDLTGEADDPLAEPESTEAEDEQDPSTLDGILARHGGNS